MHSIVIADNLTNDYCNPNAQFTDNRVNIGPNEYSRLFRDLEGGEAGILPTFIRSLTKEPLKVGIIMSRDEHDPGSTEQQEELTRYGNHAIIGTEGAEFLSELSDIAASATIVKTSSLALPVSGLRQAIQDISGIDIIEDAESAAANLRILLVGVHTERRILTTAHMMRNELGIRHVAVCPHLVGSTSREAHYAALRYHFPDALVTILPALRETYEFLQMDRSSLPDERGNACEIVPPELRNAFNPSQRMIAEVLCMHWTRAEFKELKGGFSGSFLFLAKGWKNDARMEPMVIKIDKHGTIRKELEGYERVKDLLGKNVPSFSPPVSFGESTGISMELASMEGAPDTLQDLFEQAGDDVSLQKFLRLFERTLGMLIERVYLNTRQTRNFAPYRHYLLHIDKQDVYLKGNIASIKKQTLPGIEIDLDMIAKMFKLIRKNPDSLSGIMCLAHGDLNFANIICDTRENIWAIDWTHTGVHPLEMDFAKMENDVKFVMSKEYLPEDYTKFTLLEDYLLENQIPAELSSLPKPLRFVGWDIRFKRIYEAVKLIRESYSRMNPDGDWLAYRIALLRYSIHTMSFDKSRGRGECEAIQLLFASYTSEQLCFQLVSDDFHLRIRGEKPETYPDRQRISIDEAPWSVPCPEYEPPYYVSPQVLAEDWTKDPNGWAASETDTSVVPVAWYDEEHEKDDKNRPLHPKGRTGISGRGDLGRWGPNPMVSGVITRVNPQSHQSELLVVRETNGTIQLPEGYVLLDESLDKARTQLFTKSIGTSQSPGVVQGVHQGYLYDPRQTDNAWVVSDCSYLHLQPDDLDIIDRALVEHQTEWKILDSDVINQLNVRHAFLVRNSIPLMVKTGLLSAEAAEDLASHSG